MSILDRFAQPKPYVLEVVKELRARGIKIGSTTGYTDDMMAVVVPKAKEAGYEPDTWFSPDSVGHVGRPYPYMIFQNMEALHVSSVEHVVKLEILCQIFWKENMPEFLQLVLWKEVPRWG